MHPSNVETFIMRHERIIVLALCIVAACRIFIFNAAFPLFNNVDENQHFDLVYKYSQGYLPRSGMENYSREAAELFVLYGTPEYLFKPEQFPDGSFYPPAWTYQNVRKSVYFDTKVSKWMQWKNHETGSFPVYYMVAGLWCAIGKFLGMEGGNLLYWIRFLNVPLFVVLVWFSYLLARMLFPDILLQRVGLPLIVTFFPQDVFYSINSDVISPLLFAVAFFQLLKVYFEDKSYCYHLFAGLIIAATFLTKLSNVTLLAFLSVILLLKVKRLLKEKQFKKYFPRLVTLLVVAAIPAGIWLVRNYFVLGDLSGSADKIEHLRWKVKPLGELLNHPILTHRGLFFFLKELTKTFWRGEFVWHLERIASSGSDLFYIISTAVFILVSGLGLVVNRDKADGRHRFALTMSFCLLAISVFLLAILSMLYDFSDCWYPSRDQPYLVSGRLISGVLLPFLIIYLDGLGRIFCRLRQYVNSLVVVVLICVAITCFEISLTAKVFTSRYNWFHLDKIK